MPASFLRKTELRKTGTTRRLHPAVYRILMGFVAGWILLTVTFFLGGAGGGHPYGGLVVPVVAVLALIGILIPLVFWRIRLAHPGRNNRVRPTGSLHAWLSKEFMIWDGHERARDAAIMVLLPGAAAMLGGLALVIVFHLVGP